MNDIRAVPPAEGFSKVLAPGDFEQETREQRQMDGIEIPDSTWSDIVETAESLGLSI